MTAPGTSERFDGIAEGYDRYRPGYPAAAIEALLAGLAPNAVVADVGAGTGISTRALAVAGAKPIAVEPNDEMRALARASGVDARPGTAAATGLAAQSVDAVACFQAFHWFANAASLAEFRRILKPGGRLAIVWNERDLTTEFARGFRDLERRYSRPEMLAGADFSDDTLAPLLTGNGFADIRLRTFAGAQRLDRDGAIGRMRSSSYAPRTGPELEGLLAGLDALFTRLADADGYVELAYQTELWTATMTAAAANAPRSPE